MTDAPFTPMTAVFNALQSLILSVGSDPACSHAAGSDILAPPRLSSADGRFIAQSFTYSSSRYGETISRESAG